MKDGPFGLEMGTLKEDLGLELEELNPFNYLTYTVPKPHSQFGGYMLTITPNNGLSEIVAFGKDIDTNCYGSQVMHQFGTLLEKLKNIYGECDIRDDLLPGSILHEPRDWMQSVLSGERTFYAVWSTNISNLRSIYLHVYAKDTNIAQLSLVYIFLNADAARAEIAAPEDDAL